MCTVTYLPLGEGYILTSSRDEQPGRPTSARPQVQEIAEQPVLLPQDLQAGGTWIAASKTVSLCLLNGAFTRHIPEPPYRHSRGLVIPRYFSYPSTDDFITRFPSEGLEPFTLIIAETHRLTELRWDGKKQYLTEKDPTLPHLWASATLYPPPILNKRNQWFRNWLLNHQKYSTEAIRHFHLTAGEGDEENDLFMRRALIQTVSLTSIVAQASQVSMWYQSFLDKPIKDAPIVVDLPVRPVVIHG